MLLEVKKETLKLMEILKSAGISKTVISQKTGLSRPTLDKMGKDGIENLTLATVDKLFTVYGNYMRSKEEIGQDIAAKINSQDNKYLQIIIDSNRDLVNQIGRLIEINRELSIRIAELESKLDM